MTEVPVGVSTTCHKTRGCPGPMGTVQNLAKPITPTGTRQNDPGLKYPGSNGSGSRPPGDQEEEILVCRRKCGCIRTSDKLKQILQTFPSAQPPGTIQTYTARKSDKASGYGYGQNSKFVCRKQMKDMDRLEFIGKKDCCRNGSTSLQAIGKDKLQIEVRGTSRSWQIVSELVSLVQLSVTATALALYYLIYCYMQLIYYTLRSALYFHNADGPMKITIGVVTLTSLIVGFNILMRMEGIIGIVY